MFISDIIPNLRRIRRGLDGADVPQLFAETLRHAVDFGSVDIQFLSERLPT
jgi:hypothetical protein